MSGFLDVVIAEDLGSRLPSGQWAVEYTAPPETKPPNPVPRSQPSRHSRQRARRRELKNLAYELYTTNSPNTDTDNNFTSVGTTAPQLPLCLPRHLAIYGHQLRRRLGTDYSGPCLLAAESDEGSIEYKLRLSATTPARFQQLVTQLNYRLSEGSGQCYYYIGVEDNGHPKGLNDTELEDSLALLKEMAEEVAAYATVEQTPPGTEKERKCAVVRISTVYDNNLHTLNSLDNNNNNNSSAIRSVLYHQYNKDVRIAVAGSVDSGKSTLIAILSRGKNGEPVLDDGRGSARMSVFRHKHEIETGRTSSVSHTTLAYDALGNVLNYGPTTTITSLKAQQQQQQQDNNITRAATTLIRLSDLGGHEKYIKTSLHAMTSTLPDYMLLCVCASSTTGVPSLSLSPTAREHLAVAICLGIVPCIVLTKIDTIVGDTTTAGSGGGGVYKERIAMLVEEIRGVIVAAQGSVGSIYSTSSGCASGSIGGREEQEQQVVEVIDTVADAKAGACRLSSLLQKPCTHNDDGTSSIPRQKPYTLYVPVLNVSSVSGDGVGLLHTFISSLQPSLSLSSPTSTSSTTTDNNNTIMEEVEEEKAKQTTTTSRSISTHVSIPPPPPPPQTTTTKPAAVRFQIDSSFHIATVGRIITGTVITGTIHTGDTLLLGPVTHTATSSSTDTTTSSGGNNNNNNTKGVFQCVQVVSIQRAHVDVGSVYSGQHASIAIKEPLAGYYDDDGDVDNKDSNTTGSNTPSSATDIPSTSSSAHTTDLETLSQSWQFADSPLLHRTNTSGAGSSSCKAKVDGTDVLCKRHAHTTRPRKGSVLLSADSNPQAVTTFDAILVLFNNQWPVDNSTLRDTSSPSTSTISIGDGSSSTNSGTGSSDNDDDDDDTSTSVGGCSSSDISVLAQGTQQQQQPSPHRKTSKTSTASPPSLPIRASYSYTPIVYCGGIRQAAQVVAISEISSATDCLDSIDPLLLGSIAASGIINNNSSTSSGHVRIARVKFQFVHRQEWLTEGMKLVVRDKSTTMNGGGSGLAGAGYVCAVPLIKD